MKMRTAVSLQPMDEAEIDDIPFVFTAYMREGETITSVDVTAEVEQGEVDASAQDMVSGAHAIGTIAGDEFTVNPAGTVVLQRFDATGRTRGNVYCLRCEAHMSSGRRLVAAAHMAVKRV